MFSPACRRVAYRHLPQCHSRVWLASRPFSALRPSFSRNSGFPSPTSDTPSQPEYQGPLRNTFRRLKLFSLTSFALSTTLAPFMFVVESSLPSIARAALVATALTTSGVSTALVGWCGKPYVDTLRRLGKNREEGIEMLTHNLFLQPRITRVYDTQFLIKADRYFAEWELAKTLVIRDTPGHESKLPHESQQETVAETFDKHGNVIGRWIVTWGGPGCREGTCHGAGKIIRHFNVHEELLQ